MQNQTKRSEGPTALLIGNSDGIGFAATRRFLGNGWKVIGISRSESRARDSRYHHHVVDITTPEYSELLRAVLVTDTIDLCVYFVGIGELLDLKDMSMEPRIIDTNLTGMVRTASCILPTMVANARGHFIGLSSVADDLLSAQAPSYHASKAGFTNYLGGLALALKSTGVHVTNIRFGFVDTKMAKGDIRPFMMSVEDAVDHLERCIERRPVVYTAPRIVLPLIKLRKWMMKLGARVP